MDKFHLNVEARGKQQTDPYTVSTFEWADWPVTFDLPSTLLSHWIEPFAMLSTIVLASTVLS